MMEHKQMAGRETSTRLLDWTRGQADAERLAGHLLALSGFESVDPSHPLGGRDGLRDARCGKDGKQWTAGFYFPRGQKSFSSIKNKFKKDLQGARQQGTEGFVFVTNQELRVGEREKLADQAANRTVEILHHERLLWLLDDPRGFAFRLEYLEIPMSKEDQVSFFTMVTEMVTKTHQLQDKLISALSQTSIADLLTDDPLKKTVPLADLERFQQILNEITATDTSLDFLSPVSCVDYLGTSHDTHSSGRIDRLRVPIEEMREFKQLLDDITSSWNILSSSTYFGDTGHIDQLKVPLDDLKEFKRLLAEIVGRESLSPENTCLYLPDGTTDATIKDLRVPLDQLKEYEETLDRIVEKRKRMPDPPPLGTSQ